MINNRKVIAVIPARGGSKRLPRKNVLPLAGKALIGWTIEAAINSHVFDVIMVSTDDQEIADISKKYGAEVPFIRPSHLASDTASSIDVIEHSLLHYKEKGIDFTEVVILQPTSPLRNAYDIQAALSMYTLKQASSVLSVCEVDHPTHWCNTLDNSLSMKDFIKKNDGKSRSQDFDTEYRLNGAIYILNVASFLSERAIIVEPSFASIMPRNRSIDIDENIDFEIAQAILSC